MKEEKIKVFSYTIDCQDTVALASFYAKLLDWEVLFADAEWSGVAPHGTKKGAYPGLLFQYNEDFVPPIWPEVEGQQQQMAHIDFAVKDLESSCQHALDCGARLAEQQFSTDYTVFYDPAGHTFCLCLIEDAFEA